MTFEKFSILTPNDPKYAQVTSIRNLQYSKSLFGSKLQFKLSPTFIGEICTEIFWKDA